MARILLVDDEAIVRNILRAYLRSGGHTLVEAGDGEDALAIHRRDPADLIITDNHMPRMGGEELAEIVRRDWPETRIIAISGLGIDGQLRQHVDGALAKPFSREALLSEIRRVLTNPTAVPSVGS